MLPAAIPPLNAITAPTAVLKALAGRLNWPPTTFKETIKIANDPNDFIMIIFNDIFFLYLSLRISLKTLIKLDRAFCGFYICGLGSGLSPSVISNFDPAGLFAISEPQLHEIGKFKSLRKIVPRILKLQSCEKNWSGEGLCQTVLLWLINFETKMSEYRSLLGALPNSLLQFTNCF